jgi:predicted TIM-barrel fold metal-dependent hydrolase
VVPQHLVTRAKYPFIDVHNHQNSQMPVAQLDKLVKDMDGINLQVMVNLSGGYGGTLEKGVANMKGHYKNRFVVFANIDFTDIDAPGYSHRAAAQLERDVHNGAQGLKIFKNFGMDLKDTKGQRIHVDDPRFDELFETCGRLKIPVLIHTAEPWSFFQPMDQYNERWLELKTHPGRARPPDKNPSWETLMGEQHNLFARHPNTTFIAAHLGWLGNNLAELGRLLDRLPNVNTEIAAVLYELGRQPRFAREWLIKYQDRVMFGKDVWNAQEYYTYFRVLETADEYFDYYRKYHAFWQMYGLDLPDEVLKKLYYKNALRIIPGIDRAPFPD